MAKTGKQPRLKTQQQQREDAELELIIEEFGRAIRAANRSYIGVWPGCFTPHMYEVWGTYIDFCRKHPQ